MGRVRIAYGVRESARAKRRRVVVEPGRVEVVVPPGTPREGAGSAAELVREKRRWIYEKVRAVGAPSPSEQRWLSGATIPFRGRYIGLRVEASDVLAPEVTYRSRFYVRVPRGTPAGAREAAVGAAVTSWLEGRLEEDAGGMARRFARRLGLEAPPVRLLPMKRMWASCGKDGVIRLTPELIRVPRPVLEYVVAHEVAHLVHRNHSKAFWRVVATLLPDWRDRRAWLLRYESERSL